MQDTQHYLAAHRQAKISARQEIVVLSERTTRIHLNQPSFSDFRDFDASDASNALRSKFTAHALQVSRSALFDLHALAAPESQKSLREK